MQNFLIETFELHVNLNLFDFRSCYVDLMWYLTDTCIIFMGQMPNDLRSKWAYVEKVKSIIQMYFLYKYLKEIKLGSFK